MDALEQLLRPRRLPPGPILQGCARRRRTRDREAEWPRVGDARRDGVRALTQGQCAPEIRGRGLCSRTVGE